MATTWLTLCVRTWSLLAQAPAPAAPPAAPMPVPAADPSHIVNATTQAAGAAAPVSAVQGLAIFLHMCICLGLILCVMYRNSKSEGLGSVFSGGGSSAAFRGKQSSDEMLGMWTGRLAVAFITSSFLLWIFFYRG